MTDEEFLDLMYNLSLEHEDLKESLDNVVYHEESTPETYYVMGWLQCKVLLMVARYAPDDKFNDVIAYFRNIVFNDKKIKSLVMNAILDAKEDEPKLS